MQCWLNSNIRCIEMMKFEINGMMLFMLNSNIRCIEMAKIANSGIDRLVE